MKFLVALLSVVVASAKSSPLPIYGKPLGNVKADSQMGMKLLSKARRLEQDEEIDFTWVADYSLKFQGCHHVSQWNEEADGEEDVRIQTKRLVRFRLCPTDSCTVEDAGGCDSGYGDYILDMNTYLQTYLEAVNDYNEWKCQYYEEMVCQCEDDDNQGDDFDEEKCMYDCYVQYGIEDICAENNPYEDDEAEDEEEFELEEYLECAKYEPANDNRRRKLEQDEVEYFLGPYCSEQGGAIYLGLFTDETCTTFADDYGGKEMYETLSGGESMPYGETSVIDMDCISCHEPEDFNNDGNDNNDEDQVIEMCEMIYSMAGKCETYLGIDDPNENACNYMKGIKIFREDGVVVSQSASSNRTASIFIGLFVVSFVLLAAYVYYLRTKLDRASINLSE